MSQLICHNLILGYGGQIVAENVNFAVNKGDYLCIVGENGSGKSTLVKTLLHLQKPLQGTITAGDGLTLKEIGYLPQQKASQKNFPATVQEIVLSGCLSRCGWRPFYNKAEKQRAEEAMERMLITTLADNCYGDLSGGQQQRVLLARALCATRTMLLLDEPVTGLDPEATTELYKLIKELNEVDGITIIMVSHDIKAALKDATHILHVGPKLFFGTKEAYLASDVGKNFAVLSTGEVSR